MEEDAFSLTPSDVYRRMPYHEEDEECPIRLGTMEESGISYYEDEDELEMTQRMEQDPPPIEQDKESDTETYVWSDADDVAPTQVLQEDTDWFEQDNQDDMIVETRDLDQETMKMPPDNQEIMIIPSDTVETMYLPLDNAQTMSVPPGNEESITASPGNDETMYLPPGSEEIMSLPPVSEETMRLPLDNVETIENNTSRADTQETAFVEDSCDKLPPLLVRRHKKQGIIKSSPDTLEFISPSQGSSALKRKIDFANTQSQNSTPFSPPDLEAIATSALNAGLHVANYVSPHQRILPPTPQRSKASFPQAVLKQEYITPEKSKQSTASTPSSSARKRFKATTPSPTPVHEAKKTYPSRCVKLFHKRYHFFLTGFEVPAAKQLKSQIHSYGGKVESRAEAMLNLENKCFVIATPEASRRLKFHYALVCRVPIVHPDWLSACFQTQTIVDITGFDFNLQLGLMCSRYWIPVGMSWTLKRSLVRPSDHNSKLLRGMRFGIPYDVSFQDRESIKALADAAIFLLERCGATSVIRDVKKSAIQSNKVDVILSNEQTYICSVAVDFDVPVVRFSWIYECMIQQQVVDIAHTFFSPDRFNDDGKLVSKVMEVSLPNEKKTKLCVGELVLVDTSKNSRQHHLKYQVCQVVRMEFDSDDEVIINVQLYKRSHEQSQGVLRARKNGQTPLHVAAMEGFQNAVSMLLSAQANVNQLDNVQIL
ncbi:hypothetical protein THRCLA_09736 [Thraustotheca clavata]|uniref:BRCT domain-containing protein n=1 Tax=Thraustotheca clavata TaxID=74557 RepID=A0A1V9YUU7_9STRA|nr:hypothetical protein THRCLA_09736 [Thraustotheca clavata]